MEHKSRNLKTPPALGKTSKPHTYCGASKENILSNKMPPCKKYMFSDHDFEKCMKINSEFNAMKLKHKSLIEKCNLSCGDYDTYSESSSTGTEYSLQHKSIQIFHRSNSFLQMLSNEPSPPLKQIKYKLHNKSGQNLPAEATEHTVHQLSDNKENVNPFHTNNYKNDQSLQNVYFVIDNQSKSQQCTEVLSLKNTIAKLQNDSERFCLIIDEQKNTLSDYRLSFAKAQQLVQEQQIAIDKLNSNNQQLETEASVIIDQLRHKVDTKLTDVDFLADIMRDEQLKRERAVKENCILNDRIDAIQAEANQLKVKLEKMSRQKMATISRLKVAEQDLKIFKNYNATLKQEKLKLNEQMKRLGEQIENMQNTSKRTMTRQREQNEKQRRELQKRVLELEMKLNRNQNSTTSLIKKRESLIAELQTQLNSLVHNFEVSQKHIGVLRRHIYAMCGNNCHQSIKRNRGMGETV